MKFQIIIHYGVDNEFTIDDASQHAGIPAPGDVVEVWGGGGPHPIRDGSDKLVWKAAVTQRDWEYSERISACHLYLDADLGE